MIRALVIDDDPDIVKQTELMLKSEGYEVESELDDKKALAHLSRFKPNVIILDVMFPDNSTAGFDLARSIRDSNPNVPIIMVTAVNQYGDIKFGSKDIDSDWLPISEFIEKPVRREHLIASVKRLLKK